MKSNGSTIALLEDGVYWGLCIMRNAGENQALADARAGHLPCTLVLSYLRCGFKRALSCGRTACE